MAPAEPPPTQPPPPTSTPATGLSPEVPRLWPALPSETRRSLAQEWARLLKSMRTRVPSAAAPGTETIHAEHVGPR
jgi:hypothetical protein